MKKTGLLITLILFTITFTTCYLFKKSSDYYGIDITDVKSVIFLIDISGSMEGKVETDLQGNIISEATDIVTNEIVDHIPGGGIIKGRTQKQLTKLGKAKKELIPAIRGLEEDIYFTVIVFENNVESWRKDLVKATSSNKNLTVTYLEALKSGGGTNIYEALEEGFKLAGAGCSDTTIASKVDMIFLLSDGAPTAGAVTSTNGILDQVKIWNLYNRVIINTIGLGKDCDKIFMKNLAEANGGVFIDN